jgi:hypothetical protein
MEKTELVQLSRALDYREKEGFSSSSKNKA